MLGLNEKGVVKPKVLKIVNGSRDDHPCEVCVVHTQHFFQVTRFHEIVACLTDVDAMSLIMICDVRVAILNRYHERLKRVWIYLHR